MVKYIIIFIGILFIFSKCDNKESNDSNNLLSDSLKYYNRLLEKEPDNISALLYIGRIQEEYGNIQGAMSKYERVIELDTTNYEAYNLKGSLLSQFEKYKTALYFLKKSILYKPNYSPANNNLSMLYQNLEVFDSALIYIDLAINYDSLEPIYYYNRGNLYFNLDSFEKAKSDLHKCIMLDSTFSKALYGYGVTLIKEGKKECGCNFIYRASRYGENIPEEVKNVCDPLNELIFP